MAVGVLWSYYDKQEFDEVNDKYLPISGQGDTKATQIVTAVNKLVYKWYNDGDVFDNTKYLAGWCNDLSSYANWLAEYADADDILSEINDIYDGSEYEELLKELADRYLNMEYLDALNSVERVGDIYHCDGPYRFIDADYDEYDESYWDEDEEEYYE